MKLNFTPIKHSGNLPIIEIQVSDKIIDIHNACEFMGFTFALNGNSLLTKWKYYPNYQEDEYHNFEIIFNELVYFEVTSWDESIPFNQNRTLDELVFDTNYPNRIILDFNGGLKLTVDASSIIFQWCKNT